MSADFYRLFLTPGLYHCQGGPGPNVLNLQFALEKWVEQGVAPETIAATKHRDDKPDEGATMSRPLCPYPKQARYNSAGDPAEASSFSCGEGTRYPLATACLMLSLLSHLPANRRHRGSASDCTRPTTA